MSRLVFTPWKSHSQLLAVRDQFYPSPTSTGPDLRSRACATVSGWKLRGNLPHSIEATSLLTDAILHDDAIKNSAFSIRATYAIAFCRFVTLLVDSKLHGQRKTMFQRAVDLGLPASFVELRHEATHRDLPSLVVLRNATQRSLEWLWDFYWGKLECDELCAQSGGGEMEEDVDAVAVMDALRGALGVFTGDAIPSRKKRKGFKLQVDVAMELGGICRGCRKGGNLLASILIREGHLVPRERKLGDSLGPAFSSWERLLQLLVGRHTPFLTALSEEMVNELGFAESSDPKNSPFCEGVYMWLDHILTSESWELSREILSFSYILAVCDACPNHWTRLLNERIRNMDHGSVIPSIPQTEMSQADMVPVPKDSNELKKHGWEFMDRWESRPIGYNSLIQSTE